MKKLKEKGKKVNSLEQKAKMGVLGDLRDQAAGMMNDKLKGLKKVEVSSDSPKGLEKGLNLAKDIVHSEPSEREDLDSKEYDFDGKPEAIAAHEGELKHESEEAPGEESCEHLSDDELDEKLKSVLAEKAKRDYRS